MKFYKIKDKEESHKDLERKPNKNNSKLVKKYKKTCTQLRHHYN